MEPKMKWKQGFVSRFWKKIEIDREKESDCWENNVIIRKKKGNKNNGLS